MSSKGPYIEGLSSRLWHYWDILEPLGHGAKWKEVRSLVECLEGSIETPPLIFLLLPGCNKVSHFLWHTLSYHDGLLQATAQPTADSDL